MSFEFIYAVSLAATFIAWYACTLIPNPVARGILRATIIALLCSPGILIGHGFALAPTLFALYAQPSIFTFGSMLMVWLIALGVILGVPALRRDRSQWPPSPAEIFLRFYAGKFFFFGVVAAALMLSLVYADPPRRLWLETLKYGLFFSAAAVNLTLCHWAARVKQANPLLTPLFFSVPVLIASPPNVTLMWYGAGAIGGLIGRGQQRIAAWVSLGVFGLLCLNSTRRIYLAATAAPHVTIGGGVTGNAAMALLFAGLAIVPWWILKRQPKSR